MFEFTKEMSLIFLEYCTIQEFVNIACLSKEYLHDIRYYFKIKKKIYKKFNIKKTINNCLLKLEYDEIIGMINKTFNEIVKIVKVKKIKYGKIKDTKIYYWCISSPIKIGSVKNGFKTVIYPNHRNISDTEINDDNLIPFH